MDVREPLDSAAVGGQSLTPVAQALVDTFAHTTTASGGMHLLELARVLRARGYQADAARLAIRALSGADHSAEVKARARQFLAQGLPRWHIPLLHDHVRAEAYDRAIRAAVRPGMVVLDIGTGSGVLAMMAARAGAECVVACEQNPVLALIAEENVRRNGLSSRIKVVAKHSTALVVGEDLPRRADLLVSEIVTNHLLGQDILAATADARARLLTDDARAIPAEGQVLVALAEGDFGRRALVGAVSGLDLSFTNVLRGVIQHEPETGLTAMSEALPILSFDFSGRQRTDHGRGTCTLTAARSAMCVGFLQSMRLRLDEHETLATDTPWTNAAWERQLFGFAEPRAVDAGQAIHAAASYGADAIFIWEAPSS